MHAHCHFLSALDHSPRYFILQPLQITGQEEKKRESIMVGFNRTKTELQVAQEAAQRAQLELERTHFELHAKKCEYALLNMASLCTGKQWCRGARLCGGIHSWGEGCRSSKHELAAAGGAYRVGKLSLSI